MKRELLLLLFYIFIGVVSSSAQHKEILDVIQGGVEKLTRSESVPPSLLKALEDLSKINDAVEADDAFCKSCQIVINTIIVYRKTGASRDSMITYFNKLCRTFTDWGTVACQGYVDIEIDAVLFMIDNKRNLTSERVCAIYFQERKCVDPNAKKWTIDIPPRDVRNDSVYSENEAEAANSLKILHLTDIHYDPLYTPGSDAVCDKPLCCQTGTPVDPKNAAGYWGDYNVCDMPKHSVENLLQHIKEKHLKDVDFIYYTGDIISHKSWSTSKEQNTETIRAMYELFSKIFENKTVYPILGNHESHPTDFFAPENFRRSDLSSQWVFNLMISEWSRWLPESTQTSIKRGGYYSVLVKPGFRIIALNSNVCFTSNLWLMYNDEDPYQQLVWLVEQLYEAEKHKERVHIVSHIPPGDPMCHKQWSNQFRKIIDRFAGTISAQFNGHTHLDEFRVFYDPNDPKRVTNVAFNGASFTTFVGFNPNYRIYQIDSSSAMVQNYDHYIYNLTEANKNKSPPKWYKLYSFKEAYGLPDLKLESFGQLINRMSADYDLLRQYFRFSVRESDVKQGCDKKCLKKLLCYITAVETDDSVNC